jgi:exoribonuclease-2
LLWASIDNDDSLDLDQLTVAEVLPDKSVKILVAVADVDALVKKSSAIDEHARQNTTSVYTAGMIFPMLPERLSTDLTSLNCHEDRPVIVIEAVISDAGKMQSADIYRAWVGTVPSWPTIAWRPGWKAKGPCRKLLWPYRGLRRIYASRTGWRSN